MATRPIDEKIVVMKLDNSDFKKNAAETTSLFGKLTAGLNKIPGVNLGKTTSELSAINKQAESMDMSGMSKALTTISDRFTTLGVMATTVLTNITNRATNAGIALTKSLTLDQVTAGFGEYELKIGSIQTMLANTEWAGTDLEDVKATLEDLNLYADKTIYDFGQMTSSIGKFTAAGVGLDESAQAIKGLSNLAAVSGADVNQLNTAMYQMSQSMAAGTFNLMDWNSLTNAGMGGKKLQDELLATAEGMGVVVDTSEGFRQSIGDGWLSADIFLATMQKFSKDKTMIEAATSVRTFSTLMDTLKESIGSGWATTFEHIFGDFDEATKFWTDMADATTGFFEKSTKERNELVKGIADGGGFMNIFDGIGNAVQPVLQVFDALREGFERVFPPAGVDKIVQMTESFKEFTAGLTISEESMSRLTTIFQGAFSIFSTVFEIATRLGGAFLQLIPPGTGGGVLNLLEKIAMLAIGFNESVKEGNAITDMIDGLGYVLGSIGSVIGETLGIVIDFSGSLKDNLGNAIDWIVEKLKPVGQFLKDAFGGFGGDELLGAGTLVGVYAIIKKITGFFEGSSDILGDITDGIVDTFEGIGDAVNEFTTSVKYANLMLIAISIGILAASLKTLEGLSVDEIATGITALASALGVMIGGMMVMSKFQVTGGLRAAASLIALATAVTIMASALKKVSDLDTDELVRGITGLVAVTAALAAAIIAISKWGGRLGTTSLQLIALSTAVTILASAVEKMAAIKASSLVKSIGALTIIFAQLAIFLKVVDGTKFGISSALGILVVAGAINVMVDAIQEISDVDTMSLVKGLTTISVILAQIAIFSKVVGGPGIVLAGAGILLIAGAINALVGPLQTLGSMSYEELAKGLTSMSVALLAVVGAAKLMTGGMLGAASILLMATALSVLSVPIQIFANMTWGELIKGFVGLAGGLTVVAVAAMLLTPAVVPMLGFGAALTLMGVAMLAAGTGLALFGTGLGVLATMTLTTVAAIVSSLALLIQGLGSLIPAAVNFVVRLGSALISGIGLLVPQLINTVLNLIVQLIQAIDRNLPQFLESGVSIVLQLINGIGEYVPQLVNAGVQAIIDLINGLTNTISENGPQITSAVIALIGEILLLVIDAGVQVINALFGWIPGVTKATSEIGATAEETIRENFGAEDAGKDKGDEFSGALESKTGAAESAGQALANAGEDGADSADTDSIGKDFGEGFASGISSKIGSVVSAARSLASAAAGKVRSWLDIQSPSRVAMGSGEFFGEGLAIGIRNKVRQVGESAKGLALTAKDSLNKFLEGFDPTPEDNELHFRAVVDYDGFNPGVPSVPVGLSPDTSLTNGLTTATRYNLRQNDNKTPRESRINERTNTTETRERTPAVIQVVTPDRREVAKWVVDDVTEFQEFKVKTIEQF